MNLAFIPGLRRRAVVAAISLAPAFASAAVEYNAINLTANTDVANFAPSRAEAAADGTVGGRGSLLLNPGASKASYQTLGWVYNLSTQKLSTVPTLDGVNDVNRSPNTVYSLNASGVAVGSSTVLGGDGKYHSVAYAYDPSQAAGSRLLNLGTGSATSSAARGTNASGQVAGTFGSGNTTGDRGFIFTDANQNFAVDAGEIVTLNPLSGQSIANVLGVNAGGDVTGYSSAGGSTTRQAVVWKHGDYASPVAITTGTNGSPAFGQAAAINDKGDVAYYSGTTGYFYDAATGASTLLGTFGGGTRSLANGINSSDVIVGNDTGLGRGFVWDPVNGIRDINALLPTNFGYIITSAVAISDGGVIAAYGKSKTAGDTAEYAFALSPVPEPAALGVLAIAAVFLHRRRAGEAS